MTILQISLIKNVVFFMASLFLPTIPLNFTHVFYSVGEIMITNIRTHVARKCRIPLNSYSVVELCCCFFLSSYFLWLSSPLVESPVRRTFLNKWSSAFGQDLTSPYSRRIHQISRGMINMFLVCIGIKVDIFSTDSIFKNSFIFHLCMKF